jgi:hypothetical protein
VGTERDNGTTARSTGVSGAELPTTEWADTAWTDSEWVDEDRAEAEWALAASAEVARERLAEAVHHRPGGAAAGALEHSDPGDLDAPALLDGVVGLQRLVNWAQATQQRYLAALARPGVALPLADLVDVAASPLGIAQDVPDVDPARLLADPDWGPAMQAAAIKVAAVEVGCALHLAPVTARSRTERAVMMVDTLPDTLAAQEAGTLDGYRAGIIADRVMVLDHERRRRVERKVLPLVCDRAASRVRELVDRQVIAVDPEAAARREDAARRDRGVRVDPAPDGMASVRADVSAPHAQLAYGVLDHIAGTLQSAGLANGRGRNQLRADVFTDLFRSLAATGHASVDGLGRPCDSDDAAAPHGGGAPAQPDTAPPDASAATRNDPGTDTPSNSDGASPPHTDTAPPDTDTPARDDADTDTPSDTDGASPPHTDTAPPDTDTPARDDADTDTPSDTDGTAPPYPAGAAPRDPDTRLDAAGAAQPLPICLNVYVDATTLAGWDEEPAELAGQGAISPSLARALAESAVTIRTIAVQPSGGASSVPDTGPPGAGHSANPARARVCGTVLDAGRSVYRPPERTADYVIARDRICCVPGCRTRAERCDLDHRRPYRAGGATCPCNLDPLCRFHHQVKTFTGWRATPAVDGTLEWTSPIGRRYRTEPGHPLRDDGADPPPF